MGWVGWVGWVGWLVGWWVSWFVCLFVSSFVCLYVWSVGWSVSRSVGLLVIHSFICWFVCLVYKSVSWLVSQVGWSVDQLVSCVHWVSQVGQVHLVGHTCSDYVQSIGCFNGFPYVDSCINELHPSPVTSQVMTHFLPVFPQHICPAEVLLKISWDQILCRRIGVMTLICLYSRIFGRYAPKNSSPFRGHVTSHWVCSIAHTHMHTPKHC